MILEPLEPRTEPRWPAHSPQWPALTAARPAPLALPPERREPAAHAPSPAWAAPPSEHVAESRVAEANAGVDDSAARVARALCVLVRCAVDQPDETRALARRFAGSAVARAIRADVTE